MASFDPNAERHDDAPRKGDGMTHRPGDAPDQEMLNWPDDGDDWADEDFHLDLEPLAGEQPAAEPPVDVSVAPRAAHTSSTAARKRTSADGPRRGGAALGVYVTPTTVYGTLLQPTSEGIRVVRRFARQRNASGEPQTFAGGVADTVDADDGEGVRIQFGEAGESTAELFMDSEFGDLADFGEREDAFSTAKHQAAPFVFELKDLFDECAAAGFERPATAFCTAAPAVEYVELLVPDDKKKDERARAAARSKKGTDAGDAGATQAPIKRERLLARLAEVYEESFEKERVAFMPMTSRDGARRYLAIVPTEEDALGESLDLLREQSGMRSMPLRTADAEVPVLVGLARWAFPPEESENTAIVRVGSDNTLVILMQGTELHHQEHMFSVSTVDSPDTICSRVLLQQDVQGVGTVHQVIVVSEEREDDLVRGFAAFYPDARVASLRRGLQEHGVTPPAGQKLLSARTLPAVGVAVRMLVDRQKETPFEQINMLPKRLRRVRPKLDLYIAWHTLVVGTLLFFTVLFFVGMYFAQQAQIKDLEQRLEAYPSEEELSPQALQARIDSLQSVHRRITQTLHTVDSLLVGSDRWSRSLTRLSRSAQSSGSTWVEQWSPQAAGAQISGYATARDQVVQFAERMDGSINELRFDAIRDFPVYAYVLTVPVPAELPEVARYLREQADVTRGRQRDPLGGALAGEGFEEPAIETP